MGWYKAKCDQCWDSHDGTCEDYQRRKAQAETTRETQRILREQNELIRQQNELLAKKGK